MAQTIHHTNYTTPIAAIAITTIITSTTRKGCDRL